MKKSGGCGKVLSFFMGMLVGVVLIIGGVVGVGLWAYNNMSINKAEDMFGLSIDIGSEEFKSKAIKDLIPEVTALVDSSVGEIANTLGYDIPTSFEVVAASGGQPAKYIDLSEAMNIVLNGKITQVGTNLEDMLDMLTFGYLYEVAHEPLDIPNIKLFTRYQNVKLLNVGNIINQITISDIMEPNMQGGVEVPYTGVLGALSDKTIVYLMQEGNMESVINDLKLKDVVTIPQGDTGVLGALQDLKIGELNNDNIVEAISDKKLSEILNITATTGVMAKLKDVTIGDISAGNIDEEIESLRLSEVIDITDTSGVIFALKDKTIGELNADTVMDLYIKDIYTITDTNGVMHAIKDWKLSQMTQSKFMTLKINQILDLSDTETGVLGAVSNWTLDQFTEENIQDLRLYQVLNITTSEGIMGVIKNLKLRELTEDNIKSNIQTLRLEEVINLDSTDNLVWNAIKSSTIGELETTLNSLTLSKFVKPNGTGVDEGKYVGLLGYLIDENKDPLISELDSAIEDAVNDYMQDVTIGELIDENIISEPTGYTEQEMLELRAMTLVEFLNDNLSK